MRLSRLIRLVNIQISCGHAYSRCIIIAWLDTYEVLAPSADSRRHRSRAVASQEELRQRLDAAGIDATQATISRDLKELGLVKRAGDGAYVRPGAERGGPAVSEQLRRAVASLMRGLERVDALLVVRTDRGQAQGLAEWIDRAQLPEVAGTIGGDDTILLDLPWRRGGRDGGTQVGRDGAGLDEGVVMERIVLAYSGGLDTSVAIPWLAENMAPRS